MTNVQRTQSASPFESQIGFSRAVRNGDRIVVSGTAPIGPDGQTVVGGPYEQAQRCFAIMLEALAQLGAGPEHVVRTRMYITDPADWEEIGRAHGDAFREVRPAATMVVVAALLDPAWKVEIELEAALPARIVRPARPQDRAWIVERVVERFGAETISRRGQRHVLSELPGWIVWEGGARAGLLTWRLDGEDGAEIVLIDCEAGQEDLGAVLLADAERRLRALGCRWCWSVVTNDDLHMLKLLQHHGFLLEALFVGAHGDGRIGLNGLPIRDEIVLKKEL